MKQFTKAFVLCAVVTLAACTQIVRLDPTTVELGPAEFDTNVPWNKLALTSERQIWTIDGLPLQTLNVISGTGEGDRLFGNAPQFKGPLYDASMSLPEQADYVLATLRATGYPDVTTESVRPFKIGTLDAFRVTFSGQNEDGLDILGTAVGFASDGELNTLLYIGAKVHYYEKMLPEVEAIFSSLRETSATS